MNDNYVEQIVECRPPKQTALIKVLLILLCIVSVLFIVIPYVGMFLTAGVIVFTIFMFRSFNYEYEYTLVGGELDVDKVIAKSKRKKMGTFDFNKLEIVAPVSSQEAKRLENSNYKTFDYTSNMPEAKVYVAYVMNNNETVRLLFEPNEKILHELSYLAPRKVVL